VKASALWPSVLSLVGALAKHHPLLPADPFCLKRSLFVSARLSVEMCYRGRRRLAAQRLAWSVPVAMAAVALAVR